MFGKPSKEFRGAANEDPYMRKTERDQVEAFEDPEDGRRTYANYQGKIIRGKSAEGEQLDGGQQEGGAGFKQKGAVLDGKGASP